MSKRSRSALAVLFSFVTASALPAQDGDPYEEDIHAAQSAFLKGKYSKARALLEDVLDAFEEEAPEDRPGASAMAAARRGLMRIDLVKGQYGEVRREFKEFDENARAHPEAILLEARADYRTGEYEAAIKALRGLVANGVGGFEAHYRLGLAVAAAGTVAAARSVFSEAVAIWDKKRTDDPMDVCYVGKCLMELGGRSNMERAARLLVRSIKAAPQRTEARIAYARLHFEAFRESKGYPNAEKLLKPLLNDKIEVEDALLLLYRSRGFNMFLDGGKTAKYLRRALALNPNSVPALVERGKRLIDDRLFEVAIQVLDQALGINGRHREALAHRAAAAHLTHDAKGAKRFRELALAGRKEWPEVDRIFGDHLVALYRFGDSVQFFRKALAVDPNYVPAMHGLAKALVYLGKGGEANELLSRAKNLEKGFADAWRKNILLSEKRLSQEYELVRSKHFLVLMHKQDRAVLEQYLLKWFEAAYEVLGKKYGYFPKNHVRVEVLHEWVDFSVRTIGFRGFSALGACFGEFITMVSPSDPQLRRNDFMWSATAWHEYGHVLTLALSKHRVPRWLTEGMSVYEESQKNVSWERGMLRDLLDAYHNQEIAPLRLLNRVFRGSRILFGYYQGGLVVEYLSKHHGFDKVVAMLKAYGEDKGTEQIMRDTFGMSSREFDRRFKEWVRDKKIARLKMVPRLSPRALAKTQARVAIEPEDLAARLRLAWFHVRRTNGRGQRIGLVEAGTHLGAVLRKQPKQAMANLCLGELNFARGRIEAAVEAYKRGFKAGADEFECRLNLGNIYFKRDELDDARAQYQAAKRCWPNCTDQALSPQLRIATILRKQGKRTAAMMEIKSFCRLTARAFTPRLQLAAYERELGNRRNEAKYLEQAVQIDPFMLALHDRLGDAYVATDRLPLALREYEVALAVPAALDREYMDKPEARPAPDSPEAGVIRAQLLIKIARVYHGLKDREKAFSHLDRAAKATADGDILDRINELRQDWAK